jgi:predicted nucleotidyltransferase
MEDGRGAALSGRRRSNMWVWGRPGTTLLAVFEAVRDVLLGERRVAYALVFGSSSRAAERPDSDLDVAVGLFEPLDVHEIGDLITRLESACGRTVDLVLMNEAPIALAYRVFREGVPIVQRDRQALVRRKARAVLDYLDFKPIEELCTRGVLAAARDAR